MSENNWREYYKVKALKPPAKLLVRALGYVTNMNVIELREEEHDGVTARGDKKHWHVFHVIAEKL